MEKLKFQNYSLRRKQRRRHTNLRNYAAFIITTIFVVVTASCVKSAHLNVNTIQAAAAIPAIKSPAANEHLTLTATAADSSFSLPQQSSSSSVQKLQHLTKEEEAAEEAAEEAVEIELQESSLYNLPVVRDLESVVAATINPISSSITTTTTINALNTAIDTDTDTNSNTLRYTNTNNQDVNSINTNDDNDDTEDEDSKRNIPTHSENDFSLQENISQKQQQQEHQQQVQHTRHTQHQHQHFDHHHSYQHHHGSHHGNQHKQHSTPTSTQHRHHQHFSYHHNSNNNKNNDNNQLMQNNYDFIKPDDVGDQIDRNSPQAAIKSADEYYTQTPWHKHHSKYSIEDLLNMKFEKKISNDIDMDPCKAGKL